MKGELKLNEQGNGVRRAPLRAKAELDYDERTLAAAQDHRRDMRFYRASSAKVHVGDTQLTSELVKDRRLIAVDLTEERQVLYSPWGPLQRDQLELVDVQCSSSAVARLLPNQPVQIGESWEHDANTLALLLRLDVASDTTVSSTLRKVEDRVAIVDLKGKVSGAVGGVASDLELQAKYNVDLSTRLITWMAMTIKEDRAIGHAEPGLDVVARVRMAVQPSTEIPELSDDALRGVTVTPEAGARLLEFASSAGSFHFLHGRDWRLMVDRHNVSILRLVENGDLLAQCNVSTLPDLSDGQVVTLPVFQADIERALDDGFGEFVETSESTNQRGHRVLRVIASGTASGLPVQWWYHHVSDKEGRQASVVFTTDEKSTERFAGADQIVIDSFDFSDRNAAVTPVSVNEQ